MRVLLLLSLASCVLAGLPNLPTLQELAAEDSAAAAVRVLEQPATFRYQQPGSLQLPTTAGLGFVQNPVKQLPVSRPTAAPAAPVPAATFAQQSRLNDAALMPQLANIQMPHIVSLDVSCLKESMTVRLKFDSIFNGIVYSKGFYNNPPCRYVPLNSGRDYFEFTIRLDACGSQFVDQVTSGAAAYLENAIVIQNEEGIQEMWDTSRRIRCLWEGLSQKTVTYSFGVDMLDSQIVAFSGDTASVFMDLQVGKGPNAPAVNGLVKIGETLTMIISVEGGAAGFDIQVKDCVAHDGSRTNPVVLTDNRGCVLKKKLMGPWQKSHPNGGPVLAYSFFQAFKFPDTLDIFLECNVELCKTQCDICPEDSFNTLSRSKRALEPSQPAFASNSTGSDVRIGRRLRVLSPEDISYNEDSKLATVSLTNGKRRTAQEDVCMSMGSFVVGLVVILLILIVSCVMTALLCIKVRSIPGVESTYAPSSFHAFSSSASKA